MAAAVDSPDAVAMLEDTRNRAPLVGMVISVILAMVSLVIISSFLTQRFLAVKAWNRLPFVQWLVFAIYTDSFLFVFATGILQFGLGVDASITVCESAILLCLACYVTTKILIYLFLVEKAYIIRSGNKKLRLQSKLYIFNSFGMIGIYTVVVVLNFVFRITRMDNGQCIIGMKKVAMIPLITFDLLVNIYLTILFLIPLSSLYSFRHMPETLGNRRLKLVAMRTFVGCVCTLTSSIVNLSVLMALNGEPGWVCLMCCNSDVLFSAAVIQWVTSRDSMARSESLSLSHPRSHTGPGGEDKKGGGLGGIRLGLRRKARTEGRDNPGDGSVRDEDLEADAGSSSRGARSVGSSGGGGGFSPRITPSTKAIIDDVAEISLDNVDSIDHAVTSPPPPPQRQQPSRNARSMVFDRGVDDGDKASSPQTSAPAPAVTIDAPLGTTRMSPTEVRVDVDYGASLSREAAREGVKLGNSIVIGAGHHAGGMRRERSSSWRYGDGGP